MKTQTKVRLTVAAAAGAILWRALARRRQWSGFDGRVVLITGGSRGLGLVLAREFVKRGALVAICARDASELELARADLEARGGQVFARICDVTDAAQASELVAAVEEHWGRLDVLVNNAGIIQVGAVDDQTLDDYKRAMDVHFWAPLHTIRAALPGMRRRGGGRVVNVASIGGKIGVPHLLPYDASKFALVGLSEGLRAELARDRIWVTTVCPGLMRTGSPPNALFKGQHKREYAWFSIGGSLPVASMSAERAARQIIGACRRGDAEVILGLPFKAAARLHGLFPGTTAAVMGLINRLLPRPGGPIARRGRDSESAATSLLVTPWARAAERRNNER